MTQDAAAWEYCKNRARIIEELGTRYSWDIHTGVTLGAGICSKLENNWGRWGELVITSREMEGVSPIWPDQKGRTDLITESYGGLIINLTSPQIIRQLSVDVSVIESMIWEAQLNKCRIIILWKENDPFFVNNNLLQQFTEIINPALSNPWSKYKNPTTMENCPWKVAYWSPVGGVDTLLDNILGTGNFRINKKQFNMYEEDKGLEEEDPEDTLWKCPFCNNMGIRMNRFYGICKKKRCLAVCTEGTKQDITMGGEGYKNTETLWLDYSQLNNQLELQTKTHRTFFTDGAGSICNKASGIKLTSWATVEVETILNRTEDGLCIKKMQVWKDKSKGGMKSIPWCEARAILKAVEIMNKEESLHIITDSKISIQALKSLLIKSYKKSRKIKNKPLLSSIVQTLKDKKGRLMLEWVKSHCTEANIQERNWISDLKILGNRWADEEAETMVP